MRYLLMMAGLEKPSAFRVPIWVRSSPTMRLMVVMHTRAAMRRKNTGRIRDTPLTISALLSRVA